jgi:hypothetical protein
LNEAPKIWLNDPDEEVKSAALVAWAGYYSRSKNPKMLKILYAILNSNKHPIRIRSWALSLLFTVSDTWVNSMEAYDLKFDEIEDPQEFTKLVDWPRIHKVMEDYVPGWQSVDPKN